MLQDKGRKNTVIVGFDVYPRHIFKTGVRIVIDNLWTALTNQDIDITFIPLEPRIRPLQTTRHAYGAKLLNHLQRIWWTQVGLPAAARQSGCNVLFCTCMFSPYFQPLPTVTLIYDMAIWRHPEWYPRWWYLFNRLFCELPARSTPQQITTISQDARKDIIEFFRIPPERVTSIYPGLDMPEVASSTDVEVLQGYGLSPSSKYILYMGPALLHKNLPALVEAFGRLTRLQPEQNLLLVIGGPASNTHGKDVHPEVHAAIKRFGMEQQVRFTGYVLREHCTILYRNALMYAFPSWFEGFGLPMIEAMACGTPVVAANRTALPEVGGDAAIYFDPFQIDSIVRAMYLVVTQPQLREHMAQKGRIRARQFTWTRAADAYSHLFRALVSNRRLEQL
jgi:glycosyltransferase involved in cell wall biosynthesis